MRNPRKPGTWMEKINTNIMPYVDNPKWENRYPTTDGYPMTKKDKKDLQQTSENIVKALSRLVEALKSNDKMPFDLLNMTEKLTPYIIEDNSPFVSNIARLDFVKDKNGTYKLVEINADTPCGIPETFYANKIAEQEIIGHSNRSDGSELAKPFTDLLDSEAYKNAEEINIIFTAAGKYEEDWANTKYIYQKVSDVISEKYFYLNVKFALADLSELIIHDNGVSVKFIPQDNINKKTILYRLHPLELLMDDESTDGYPVGLKLLESKLQ